MIEYLRNLNRLEFMVTNACTGKCKHCSEGDHAASSEHIEADAAVKAIFDICNQYEVKSLMTFGGEALLYPEVVCQIHKAATKVGIPKRDLITNGYFSKDKTRIREVAEMLAGSGVRCILLSVDAFHQETIPLEPVKYFAECIQPGDITIKLNPAWLVSKSDDNPYNVKTREIIKEFEYLRIPVGSGNVIFPSGNALKYLAEYFNENVEASSPYDEDPEDVRTIAFSPNGDVLNGNIYADNIVEIINAYKPIS